MPFHIKTLFHHSRLLLCCLASISPSFLPALAPAPSTSPDSNLDEPLMVVDSDVADYNGKSMTLSGHVVVEHELGKISADWIQIIPQTIRKKLRLNTLTMKEDVNIALKDGGHLSCASAFLDYVALKGRFEGGDDQQFVVFNENCPDKNGTLAPLTVKSKQMLIKIAHCDTGSSQAPHSYISTISANDSVTVNYNNDFIAAADYATYQRLPLEANNTVQNTQMPGLITLRADTEDAVCQVTNRNKDIIKANTICIDTVKRQLLFSYPKGAIYTPSEKELQNRVDFSAGTMTWDDQNNALTLCDHVTVSQKGIGRITTDKEIRLTQGVHNGMKQLQSIASSGPTTLFYNDDEKELAHTLVCHGLLFVDHKNLQTVMESPRDAKGEVMEGCQVHFQDDMGEIYADKIVIKYALVNNVPAPTRMILEGHVHLMNRCAIDAEGPYLQFALADRVEYKAEAKEVHLSAKGKGRILFFDKLNNLQVSAPGLKIRRDQVTNKDSVQGIGNVRFSFVEKEFAEMNKYFHLEEWDTTSNEHSE